MQRRQQQAHLTLRAMLAIPMRTGMTAAIRKLCSLCETRVRGRV